MFVVSGCASRPAQQARSTAESEASVCDLPAGLRREPARERRTEPAPDPPCGAAKWVRFVGEFGYVGESMDVAKSETEVPSEFWGPVRFAMEQDALASDDHFTRQVDGWSGVLSACLGDGQSSRQSVQSGRLSMSTRIVLATLMPVACGCSWLGCGRA